MSFYVRRSLQADTIDMLSLPIVAGSDPVVAGALVLWAAGGVDATVGAGAVLNTIAGIAQQAGVAGDTILVSPLLPGMVVEADVADASAILVGDYVGTASAVLAVEGVAGAGIGRVIGSEVSIDGGADNDDKVIFIVTDMDATA